jgi:hypothetical protein
VRGDDQADSSLSAVGVLEDAVVSSTDRDADKVRELHGLEPHPTYGFVHISFVRADQITRSLERTTGLEPTTPTLAR